MVIGHSTYYSVMTKYGGFDYAGMMSAHGVSDSFIHRVLGVITSAIYSFHMPLFMALSGALFSRNKMRGFLPFVKSKAQRLLLPFVVVASFVSVPLKYFAGYWDGSENILRDVFVGQYLIQGNTHLWFLVTLFCEFVIFFFVRKYFTARKSECRIILFLVAVNVIASIARVHLVNNVLRFALWFYAGFCFEKIRNEFNGKITAGKCIFFFAVWTVLFLTKRYMPYSTFTEESLRRILSLLLTLTGMLWCYSFCFLMKDTRIITSNPVKLICDYSLGIYLYSDTFNYNILYIFISLLTIQALSQNVCALLLYVLRICVTLSLAIFVTWLLRKMHFKFIA